MRINEAEAYHPARIGNPSGVEMPLENFRD
jgi:hypothetical protein